MNCPALLLAGPGKSRAGDLTETWTEVGEMPMMAIDLADAPLAPDARVRRAGPADVDVVTSLLADAYGMEAEIARIPAAVHTTPSDTITIWLLEQGGEAVSTVTACRDDDVVSLWCMATPVRFERRGFGRALLGAVLQDYLTQGVATGLLGATPAGLPLYEAAGWRPGGLADLHQRPFGPVLALTSAARSRAIRERHEVPPTPA